MKKIVVKFGGSNLKSKEDINNLLSVIASYDLPIVIVISALYGITDFLIQTINDSKSNGDVSNILTQTLIDKHRQIIDLYIEDENLKDTITEKIQQRVDILGRYLLGMHYLGEVPEFAYDLALSYGERLSSLLLESILKYKGFECVEMLPEDIGLITDGEFGSASVKFDVSEKNVRGKISAGRKIYIVPGFYGVSEEGKVTLLGRGGSDYSAAVIARCIGAKSVDIWKDVPGYMSADPKSVPGAVVLKSLTYKEAAELSYFGAKILHPRTFEPLLDKSIPVRLFNIHDIPNELKPLTTVENRSLISKDVIKSVTFTDDIGILKLRGPGVGVKPGIISRTTTELNKAKINIKSIITAQTTINFLLGLEDLKRSYNLVKGIGLSFVDDIVTVDDVSLIAVVGEGMLEKPGIAARVFTAVSSHAINIIIISAGASSVATYFIVDRKDREKAIRAIHEEFFK